LIESDRHDYAYGGSHEKKLRSECDPPNRCILINSKRKPVLVSPLNTILNKYLLHLAGKGFTDNTLRVRRVHIALFLEWCHRLGAITPRQLTKAVFESYQQHLFSHRKRDGKPLALLTRYSRLAQLKVWSKWMTRQNYLLHDPASDLELPLLSYRLPSVLTKDEAELVLHQTKVDTPLGLRDRAILEMLYSTGMRRAELLNLRLDDLDRQRGVVTIREGKGRRDRVIPVGERALTWLDMYLGNVRPIFVSRCDEGAIFLNLAGASLTPNYLSWVVRKYLRAAHIARTGACHIFRHTMATLMLEGGADIRYIQAMLGHKRLNTTEIYTHVSIRMLQQVHAATHPAANLSNRRPGRPGRPALAN
jgi:integrase/recombinase XerD